MPRSMTHVRETESRDMIRKKVNSFYENGDALIREWSERDYGIDFVLELFEDGYPTGKIAFLQIKGTQKEIKKLKRTNEISCPGVSLLSLEYARQNRIPFILIYASTRLPECFYYLDLQSYIKNNKKVKDQKNISIRIPMENKVDIDLTDFFTLINSYY